MITVEQLLEIGFRERGREEDDIFYSIFFMPPFTLGGITNFSGIIIDGEFELWGLPKRLTDIKQIEDLISALQLKVFEPRNHD